MIILSIPVGTTLLLADVARECLPSCQGWLRSMVCLKQVSLGFGVQRESRDRSQVVRCLEGFFTLAVKWVKRLGSGAETGGVLTGDERTACKAAYCKTRCHYFIGRRY